MCDPHTCKRKLHGAGENMSLMGNAWDAFYVAGKIMILSGEKLVMGRGGRVSNSMGHCFPMKMSDTHVRKRKLRGFFG